MENEKEKIIGVLLKSGFQLHGSFPEVVTLSVEQPTEDGMITHEISVDFSYGRRRLPVFDNIYLDGHHVKKVDFGYHTANLKTAEECAKFIMYCLGLPEQVKKIPVGKHEIGYVKKLIAVGAVATSFHDATNVGVCGVDVRYNSYEHSFELDRSKDEIRIALKQSLFNDEEFRTNLLQNQEFRDACNKIHEIVQGFKVVKRL